MPSLNNMNMHQRISVLTIGANDLVAMRGFYEEVLGWKPVASNADIVFYQMNGFLLSLAKKDSLCEFIGVELGERGPVGGYTRCPVIMALSELLMLVKFCS